MGCAKNSCHCALWPILEFLQMAFDLREAEHSFSLCETLSCEFCWHCQCVCRGAPPQQTISIPPSASFTNHQSPSWDTMLIHKEHLLGWTQALVFLAPAPWSLFRRFWAWWPLARLFFYVRDAASRVFGAAENTLATDALLVHPSPNAPITLIQMPRFIHFENLSSVFDRFNWNIYSNTTWNYRQESFGWLYFLDESASWHP